jgi:hypothetical protein
MTKIRSLDLLYLAVVVLVGFLGSIYLAVLKAQPLVAGFTLILASVIMLGLVIRMSLKRMTKGLLLVGIAVLSPMIYAIAIESQFERPPAEGIEWVSWLFDWDKVAVLKIGQDVLKSMSTFINLACAGAGGSIIAVEGDKTIIESILTPAPVQNVEQSLIQPVIDNTAMIQSIHTSLDRQERRVDSLDQQLTTLAEKHDRLERQLLGIGGGLVSALVILSFAALFRS